MTWIYVMPVSVFFLATLFAMCLVAGGGLLIFQRFFPQSDELTHNDVAGPIIGTVGTIMAVVLSFMLVVNWQEYDGAAGTVEQEAAAVADLYQIAAQFPQPLQGRIRNELRAYINTVVNEEWPLMRNGGRSERARDQIFAIARDIARYAPSSQNQQMLQQTALIQAQTAQDSRRQRLFDNDQGIPAFMWIGNLILAGVTIALCYFFRVRNRIAHMAMTLSLAVVISVIFDITAVVDYPFRGDTQIPPTLFMSLQHRYGGNAIE